MLQKFKKVEMIFEITPEYIKALSDTDLRILIGKLAEQETIRAGYSPVSVTYGAISGMLEKSYYVKACI
jgi:hypothetical protein